MKRIPIYSIVAVGLLLTGCSTSKKVHDTLYTTAAVAEQTDLHTESRQTTEMTARTETETSTSETEDTRRIELEFDTTRPIDSATGRPPLKRVIVVDRRRNRETDIHRQTADTLKQQTEAVIQDSTRRETQAEAIVARQTEKKARPSHLPWLTVGLVLLALGWAAWRKWKK
ncbi:hypothetical protein [uncultured Rikenella sp.]|uniref:hypothetical protein n=1 Tax=uncultured Rikenella sp. TaxID=368003 RepID=UPI002627531B|nr:hypothetical protein [uncultured Rikenella sp.]